jgi:hypothetical protein
MASEQIVVDENNIAGGITQCQKASRGILDPTNVSVH